MPKTVILGAARTPFGKMGGSLSTLDATELGGIAIKSALERAEVKPDQVQHVVFGQVLGVHIDDRFVANGRLDTAAMRPIARCGYDEYSVVEEVFRMTRPRVPEAAARIDS